MYSRIPYNTCTDLRLNVLDDAGVPIAVPTGTLQVTINTTLEDGGVISFANQPTVYTTTCPTSSSSRPPLVLPIAAGASFRNVSVRVTDVNPTRIRMTATATALQPTSRVFLVPPTSISSDDLAVLPFHAVSTSGAVSFRGYSLVRFDSSSNEWIGNLATTAPSTHAIRLQNSIVMNWLVVDPLTGGSIGGAAPGFAVDGITRVFSDRVVAFGVTGNTLNFQAFQVSGGSVQPGVVYSQTALVQANTAGGGEVAALLLDRTINSTTTTGTVPLWFSTRGVTQTIALGRATYSYTGSESWGSVMTVERNAPLGSHAGHAAMSLGEGSAFMVIQQNQGSFINEPPQQMAGALQFTQAPLGTVGPEQFVHVSRTPARIAIIARPAVPGARQYDFGLYDTADGGVRSLRMVLPDQDTTTGTRAVTDPSLARGCVVNDSRGVTFFYSTRLLAESTYQHWAQSYTSINDTLSPPVQLSIPGAEDAVISCGGNVLHHVDMWRW